MIDVIVGLSILVAGIILIFSFVFTTPSSEQPTSYANDLNRLLLTTEFGELANEQAQEWLRNNEVGEKMRLGEKLAVICENKTVTSELDFFDELMNITVRGAVPENLGYSVKVINGTETCLEESRAAPLQLNPDESILFVTSRSIILARGPEGLVGPFILEVSVT